MKDILVVGVTGSIAACKAAEVVSALAKRGIRMEVIMTESATRLVTPQSFQTLGRCAVTTSLWHSGEWKPRHIELALECRALLVVPATANILAKMAHGIADDSLSTFALSHDGPVLVAPAMNPRMWRHPATVENCRVLKERGVEFIGPVDGAVACGDGGVGRMAEPTEIIAAACRVMGVEAGL